MSKTYEQWATEQETKWAEHIRMRGIALPEDGTTYGWDEVIEIRGETWALAAWVVMQADEDGWDVNGIHAGIDIDMEGWARDCTDGTELDEESDD